MLRRVLVTPILIAAVSMAFLTCAFAFPYDAIPPKYAECDLNKDGKVDTNDALIVAANFGTAKGMLTWFADADIDLDDYVGIIDLFLVCVVASY